LAKYFAWCTHESILFEPWNPFYLQYQSIKKNTKKLLKALKPEQATRKGVAHLTCTSSVVSVQEWYLILRGDSGNKKTKLIIYQGRFIELRVHSIVRNGIYQGCFYKYRVYLSSCREFSGKEKTTHDCLSKKSFQMEHVPGQDTLNSL